MNIPNPIPIGTETIIEYTLSKMVGGTRSQRSSSGGIAFDSEYEYPQRDNVWVTPSLST